MNSDKRPATGVVGPSPTEWRTSSHSAVNANCVEINLTQPELVHVRDSKDHGTGVMITVTRRQWAMTLDHITTVG